VAYPFSRVTRQEFAAIRARAKAKAARKAEKRAENAALSQEGTQEARGGARKRQKARSRKALVKAADAAFSLHIRARDAEPFGGRCSLCQQAPIEDCAHLISRGKHSVRWDPRNAMGQCRGCNLRHEYHPQYYTAWWIKRHGEEAYQALVRDSNQIAKYSRADLEEIIAKFNGRKSDSEKA